MAAAELFVHASLLTIGVFVVAAITDVVVKRIRSQPLARSGPRNRKVNQSMTKNTSACGHTPLQHVTLKLTSMARQAQQDSENPKLTLATPEEARLTATILNNIVETILVPALIDEAALELGIDLAAILDTQIGEHVDAGMEQMAAFLKSEAL
ncbi:hypothetical protein FYJ24_09535 [Actinomycetaceae bacterium WB03_NA08]|uniref:Uncharacterized protein n=1 Tax=Scrofimicrobium canadense TaxID=2652290 RepID=A0A6N7W6I7_9ACTO|nr:hypothetical protein [Scrofimicrobium canadense]MSS85001.1 hypothetical protein [Scrofimicrobium canadense]